MHIAKQINRSTLRQSAVTAAEHLLGAYLYKVENGIILAGRIVETEAYCFDDEASHSYRGMTHRNAPMFLDAGYSYVYFTYGMHHCFNVVVNSEGIGEAVLIRALEPIEGTDMMFERRIKARRISDLLSGPAKICQAFDLTTRHNSIDLLTSHTLFLRRGALRKSERISASKRIGISVSAEKLFRFTIDGNPYLSR